VTRLNVSLTSTRYQTRENVMKMTRLNDFVTSTRYQTRELEF
jgi:hypothetical protein